MAKPKIAIITGITGQDGPYLAEFLLKKDYQVVGLARRTSHPIADNPTISHLLNDITISPADLTDSASLVEAFRKFQPMEIYNLAAQSHVAESWRLPIQTAEVTALGIQRIFEAVRQLNFKTKIYQASSSEMYGKVLEIPQTEKTPFNPANPYAVSKVYAHQISEIYRKSYDMFICCGILFNHESPRRGMGFVTQKVAYGAACAKLGIKESKHRNEQNEPIVKDGKIALGNLDAERDWGFAGDYVEAMWLMLQQKTPGDYVVATGVKRSIKDLCREAYSYVGLDYKKYVYSDPRFNRPIETGPLVGDASRARKILGWKPKTTFEQLVAMMVDSHLAKLK